MCIVNIMDNNVKKLLHFKLKKKMHFNFPKWIHLIENWCQFYYMKTILSLYAMK